MEPSDEDNSKYLVKEFSTFLKAAKLYLRRNHPTEYAVYKKNTKDHKKGDFKDEIISGENVRLNDSSLGPAKKLKTWHVEGFRSLGDRFDCSIVYFYLRVKNVYFVNQNQRAGLFHLLVLPFSRISLCKNHNHILISSFSHEQVIIDGRIEKKESGQVYKGEKPPEINSRR